MLTIKKPKELNNQSNKLFWNRNRILKVGFNSELLKNTLYNNFPESLANSLKTENRVTMRRIEPFSIKLLQYGHSPERKTDYRKSDKPFYCQCINRLIIANPERLFKISDSDFNGKSHRIDFNYLFYRKFQVSGKQNYRFFFSLYNNYVDLLFFYISNPEFSGNNLKSIHFPIDIDLNFSQGKIFKKMRNFPLFSLFRL